MALSRTLLAQSQPLKANETTVNWLILATPHLLLSTKQSHSTNRSKEFTAILESACKVGDNLPESELTWLVE